MSSREDILQRVHNAIKVRYEKPDLSVLEKHALVYPDVVGQFCDTMKTVGGKTVVLKKGEDINEAILKVFPGLERIASNLPGITCATFNPDELDNPAELNGTDLAVIEGKVGVAENGAVWIEQEVKHRAVYFISERLAILLHKEDIVSNMHEAYNRITLGDHAFCAFISGPSKTADIEQALVMGAHGAREVLVVIME